MNIDILGISELKWTGMGEFNSDDHYTYYCGQKCLRRNGVAIMVNRSPKCSTWMQSQKRQNDLCSFPRQTIQYHSNPSLCPLEEADTGGHLADGGGKGVEATGLGGGCGAGEREGRGSLPSFLHQASKPGTSDSVCRAVGHNPSHRACEPLCNILLWTR